VVLVQVFRDRDCLYQLGPTEQVSPGEDKRMQSLKQGIEIKEKKITDNVQKHNSLR
jgi:hypothetical protein